MVQSARKMHPQISDAKLGNNQWGVNKQATTTTKQERKGKGAEFVWVRFAAIHSGLCTNIFHSDKYSSNLDTTHIQACVLLYFTTINTALT